MLRTAAMIAQVHAGMWRRNGFALLNQLYFYHNVKCRAEMLDRDVVMLQVTRYNCFLYVIEYDTYLHSTSLTLAEKIGCHIL